MTSSFVGAGDERDTTAQLRVLAEKFPRGGGGNRKTEKRAPISLSPFF